MKVYNFVENKNVLALFPTLKQLLAADGGASGRSSAAWLDKQLSSSSSNQTVHRQFYRCCGCFYI